MVDQRSKQVSFILRAWWERDSTGVLRLRGRIQHVASGERRYFQSFEELEGFLCRWLGSAPDEEPGDTA